MSTVNIANQTLAVADVTARFNDAQANPDAFGVQLAADVLNILRNTTTTFAHVVQATPVKLAAKNKARNIMKLSAVNVMIATSAETYARAVKNSANKQGSDAEKVDNFQAQEAWFERDQNCAALGVGKKNGSPVLIYMTYPTPRNTGKRYFIDADTNETMTAEQVAELMTPSGAKQLLDPATTHHNKTHDIEHTVSTRAVYLHNILRVVANKQAADNI